MSDFAVQVKVKNGRLLQAIIDAGYKNVAQFCGASGFNKTTIGNLLNFKSSPLVADRCDWLPVVKRLSEVLGPLPDELFPDHMQIILEANGVTYFMEAEEMRKIVDHSNDELTVDELENLLLIPLLSEKERDVVVSRVVHEETLAEIGKRYGITGQRIREIEAKALRRIRSNAARLVR